MNIYITFIPIIHFLHLEKHAVSFQAIQIFVQCVPKDCCYFYFGILVIFPVTAHCAQCFNFFYCVGFGNSPLPPLFLYILIAVLITFLSMAFIMCSSLFLPDSMDNG